MSSNKLSDEEIITFFREMFNISINREQLVNPTKDIVIGIYVRFLAEFGVENVSQPDIIATSGMENIERYETNISLWNIYKSTANIVSAAGIPDMSLSDIILPKRLRTNRILSGLCFLLVKLSNIEHKWSQLEKKCIDLPQRRQTIENRIRDLKRSLVEKSTYLSSNKNKSISLSQELKTLAEKYEQKSKCSEQLTEESRSLKTSLLNKKEKISEIDVEISQTKEEIQELDQKIVKSPERVQNESKEKEYELEGKRNEKKKNEKQYMESMRALDHLKEASKSLMPSLETFTEAFKDIENMRTQCEALHEIRVNLNNKDKKLKAFNVQLKEHEKSLNTLRQQIVNNEKQSQQQLQTVKQINNGFKDKLKTKTKNQSDEEKGLFEERIQLEKRLDFMKSEHKKFKEKSENYFKQHLTAFENVKNLINTDLNEYENMKKK